jgi:DNA polymerase-3 subunit alpha
MTSYRPFEVGEGKIFYSLAAIKGVGDAAVEHIVEKRKEKPFESLEDFCERVDPRMVNRRVFESLINAGALDCFGVDRSALSSGMDSLMAYTQRTQENANSGQSDIFGTGLVPKEKLQLPVVTPWTSSEKLHRELQAAGFYLSAHPLDDYNEALQKMRVQSWADFSNAVKKGATNGRLAGTVISKQERKTKTGNKMGIIAFSDATGQFESVLFSEALQQFRDLLEPGRSVVITVSAENRPEGVSLRIATVVSLEDEASRLQKALRLFLRNSDALDQIVPYFKTRGDGEVSFIVIKDNGQREVEVALPDRYRISPQIASAMKAINGVVDVELIS